MAKPPKLELRDKKGGGLEVVGVKALEYDFPMLCYDCGRGVFELSEIGRQLTHGGVLCQACQTASLPKIECEVCGCLARKNDSVKDRWCSPECARDAEAHGVRATLREHVLGIVQSERRHWTPAEVAYYVEADVEIVKRVLDDLMVGEEIESQIKLGMGITFWKKGDKPPESTFLAWLEEIDEPDSSK